jgi:hypothetical protein
MARAHLVVEKGEEVPLSLKNREKKGGESIPTPFYRLERHCWTRSLASVETPKLARVAR